MPKKSLSLDVSALAEDKAASMGLRNAPQQKRSLEKVARILDAAAQLLGEQGYRHVLASPEELMQRAGVSGGVFYRYFLSVEAVFDALGMHALELARQLIDDLAERPSGTAVSVFDRVIDAYLGFYEEPVVKELWLNDHLSSRVRAMSSEVNRYIESRIDQMLQEAADPIRIGALEIHVALEIAEHLLRLSMQGSEGPSQEVVTQAKLAVRAYVLSVHLSGESEVAGNLTP